MKNNVNTLAVGLAMLASLATILTFLGYPTIKDFLKNDSGNPPDTPESSPVVSRADMLVRYNVIYEQQDWCSLWNKLIQDSLTEGDCPSNILQWSYENVDTQSGSKKLLTGMQMRATGDITVHYPTCVTFGTANYTGGLLNHGFIMITSQRI